MKSRQLILLVLLILYIILIGVLSIYHAYHFSDYMHTKGDESVDYVLFLLLTSLLFQGLHWIILKRIEWKLVLLSTFINSISSFFIGLVILLVSGLSGIPKHMIFIYGTCYLTSFTLVVLFQLLKTK